MKGKLTPVFDPKRDTQSYKGYIIAPTSGHFLILKDAQIISRPATIEKAKADIDLLVE